MAQLPAYLQKTAGRIDLNKAKAGGGVTQPPRVSIRDNRFTLVASDGVEKPLMTLNLDAVIVDIDEGLTRIYFGKPFQPGQENYDPPTCASSDGVRPDANVPDQQAELCSLCTHNGFNKLNTVTGKMTKACQESKKVALFIPGEGFYVLKITPGSNKSWNSYIDLLKTNACEPQHITTRITFQSQGVLAFQALGFISEQLMYDSDKPDAVKALMKNEAPMQLAGPMPPMANGMYPQVVHPEIAAAFQTPPVHPATFGGMKPEGNPPRKRRTKAEMEAERNTLKALDNPNVVYENAKGEKATPTFGMQQPQVNADPDLSAAIAAAFAVET